MLDRKKIDPWLLSGEVVVRMWGRDFELDPVMYAEWLESVGESYGLQVTTGVFTEPPCVVVQAQLKGEKMPQLKDPQIKVSKKKTPWLFCTEVVECDNRIPQGAPPGSPCEVHSS